MQLETPHDDPNFVTSTPPTEPQTFAVEKLTGSRPWLNRVKARYWKPKTLTLTPVAILKYADAYKRAPLLHLKQLLLMPGGARPATNAEYLLHQRRNMFQLSAVAISSTNCSGVRPEIMLFAAATPMDAANCVRFANLTSFARVISSWTPFVAPFLPAWGHVASLSLKSALDVARALNIKLSTDQFSTAYSNIYGHSPGFKVSFSQFASVMACFSYNSSIQRVVEAAVPDATDNQLTISQLAHVMSIGEADVEKLMRERGLNNNYVANSNLLDLFCDPSNTVIDNVAISQPHDMKLPLNRYLISSSHNSYLIGDQLKSDSRAEMYRIILEKGCRCVEIDLWDGDDGRPAVTHGHTMTSYESFEKILVVIKEHSFSHGFKYPVILSLENHLGHKQQLIAATLMQEVLGELLYTPAEHGTDEDVLPSPHALQGRIVIKAKTGKSVLRSGASYSQMGISPELAGFDDYDTDEDQQRPEDKVVRQESVEEKETVPKIVPQIAELVFMAGGNRKALMALWKINKSGVQEFQASSCASINEKKVAEVLQNDWCDPIREYNSHAFTRVYPKGSRVDSSNYTPTLAHYLGCQIVALNWQRNDSGLAINQARFLANNGCGYILADSVKGPALPATLHVQLISGYLLPKAKDSIKRDITDTYCSIKVYDSDFSDDDDYATGKYTSEAVRSNGFAPAWQQSFEIPILNRALAVLLFRVYDHDRTSDDDLVAYCAVPTSAMRTGMRCFPLTSKAGDPFLIPGSSLGPSVLCNIRWQD